MNFPATLFSPAWHWVAGILSVVVIFRVLIGAPWRRLATNTQRNLLFGLAVSLALLWSMKAGVRPGLNLHLMGSMAATLALGPHFAVVSMGIALTALATNGGIEWAAWPINFVLMVIVPVGFARVLQRLIEATLPSHFFIFIFVLSFMGSALVVVLQGLVACLAMVAGGAYPFEFLLSEYLPYFILLGFSEAWISGAVITLLVVYRPEWVWAFDDKRYLVGK